MKTNILWIVMDHVTFRHYMLTKGARPVLSTYEKLASEGIEFTNCHSVHPLCLPARASMMTGVYSHKNRKISNSESIPDAGYPLFFDALQQQGYLVGYFGKNHSGYEDLRRRGIEGFYPPSYGKPYLSEEYRSYLKNHGYINPIYHQEWHIKDLWSFPEDRDYDLTKEDNFNTYSAGFIKTPGRVHESDFVTEIAGDWIADQVKNGESFAVRVDTWGPHHAYQVPLEFKDLIDETKIEEYPGYNQVPSDVCKFSTEFVNRIRERNSFKSWDQFRHVVKRAYEQYSYIDSSIGRLLDRLKDIGAYDNTAVIITADHGDSLGSHGGMVDKCGDMTEELMHIPLVIKCPAVNSAKKCSGLVSNMDIVPTVLEMAGCSVPTYMDGKSLVPLLETPLGNWREDLMCEHYGHFDVHKVQRAVYFRQFKYVAIEDDRELLYDLEKDQFELHNLAENTDFVCLLTEMRLRLRKNLLKFGDTFETQMLLK